MAHKRGFTLVELLVVISIIALLLSVMMPALTKARELARQTVCKSNLHGYNLALMAYIGENRDTFPYPWTAFYTTASSTGGHQLYCRWHDEDWNNAKRPANAGPLWSYLAAAKGHLCPTFAEYGRKLGANHASHDTGIPVVPQYSYSQNAFLGSNSANLSGAALTEWVRMNGSHTSSAFAVNKCSAVKTPSRTFSFAEENPWPNARYSESNGWKYGGAQGMNDNALVTSWVVDALVTNYKGNIVIPYVDIQKQAPAPDSFATFHRTSSGKKELGVGDALMLDGSVADAKAVDVLQLAWPHKKY